MHSGAALLSSSGCQYSSSSQHDGDMNGTLAHIKNETEVCLLSPPAPLMQPHALLLQ